MKIREEEEIEKEDEEEEIDEEENDEENEESNFRIIINRRRIRKGRISVRR